MLRSFREKFTNIRMRQLDLCMDKWKRYKDFTWRIRPHPDSLSQETKWSNPDLDPIGIEARCWASFDLGSYWLASQYTVQFWSLGSSLSELGYTLREAIPITFCALLITGAILLLCAEYGTVYRTPFPVNARCAWGYYGAFFPITLRLFFSCFWLAILSFESASVVEVMMIAIYPRFKEVSNRFKDNAGLTSSALLAFIAFMALQIPVSLVSTRKQRYFFRFQAFVTLVTVISMLIWSLRSTLGHGSLISSSTVYGNDGRSVLTALNMVMSAFSYLTTSVSDVSRLSKQGRISWWYAVDFAANGSLLVATSLCISNACDQLYKKQEWQVSDVLSHWTNRPAVFFCSLVWMVACIGGNIATHSINLATELTSLWPRYLTITRASLVGICLTFLLCPWKILMMPALYDFLKIGVVLMAPITGIMIFDFWIVRERVLDIRELYAVRPHGALWFNHGINWRAFLAFGVSVVPNVPGLVHTINPSIKNRNPATYCIAWLFGLFVSGIVYTLLTLFFPPMATLEMERVHVDDLLPWNDRIATTGIQTDHQHTQSPISSGVDYMSQPSLLNVDRQIPYMF